MKAPKVEPLLSALIENPSEFRKVLSADINDVRYLPWDRLRYKTPPAGLTHEQWWVALVLKRRQQSRPLELRDKNGHPFSFVLTDEILRMSEEVARRAGASYSAQSQELKNADKVRYIVRSLMEESITSSQLEGASTSRRVAVEMLESGRKPISKSEIMIVNNYRGMQWVKENAEVSISPENVKELHRILTEDTLENPSDAGRLETPDHDRVAIWDNVSGEKLHAPPAAELLPQRLEELCNFANDDGSEGTYIPPVVRAIIVHFMFGYDHYFVDGNGRTARTMFYWIMLASDYWLCEYITISKPLRQAPSEYSRAYIYCEDEESDLTYFIHYQLGILLRALDELDEFVKYKQTQSREVSTVLSDPNTDLSFRQTDILRRLADEDLESVSATTFARRYRVSDQTARNDLRELELQGFLTKHKKGRAHIWRASPALINKITSSQERKPSA